MDGRAMTPTSAARRGSLNRGCNRFRFLAQRLPGWGQTKPAERARFENGGTGLRVAAAGIGALTVS